MKQCKYCGMTIAKHKHNQVTCGGKPCTLAANRDRNRVMRSKLCIVCKTLTDQELKPKHVRGLCRACYKKSLEVLQ